MWHFIKFYNMSKSVLAALVVLLTISCTQKKEVITVDPAVPEAELNVFVVADAGRNGSYDQTKIGEIMGVYADKLEPEYILNCGDMFHYNGVESVNDPLFISNYENIYKHGELQCKWWGVLGNHEYRGNTEAVIEYTNISRRWNIPARYYTKTMEGANDTDSVCVVFMDTAPMIDKYHIENEYPDARLQDPELQIAWLDSTLNASKAKWKIVVGHHPVYSYSKKSPKETSQMQNRVAGIFKRNNVDISLSGHVHTFQHLKPTDAVTDYFVSPSASLARSPKNGEFTTFAGEGSGFLVLGFNNNYIAVTMINAMGKVVYSYNVEKRDPTN